MLLMWEKSDSDIVVSLGGTSISNESSADAWGSLREDSIAAPTKQQRVLISSIIASVNTSSGILVVRLAAGTLTAPVIAGGGI